MANATVYVMEAANMICGDTGNSSAPGISTHLVLQELKLPTLEEATVDHNAGGAPVGIEVPTHLNKLEATFNLAGWNPGVMAMLGSSDFRKHIFTAYGLIRDRRTGDALNSMARIEGRLGRVNPTAFSKGAMMSHEFSIKSITSYTLLMETDKGAGMGVIYDWDFYTSTFVVGGLDINRDMINILHIPAQAVDNRAAAPADIVTA